LIARTQQLQDLLYHKARNIRTRKIIKNLGTAAESRRVYSDSEGVPETLFSTVEKIELPPDVGTRERFMAAPGQARVTVMSIPGTVNAPLFCQLDDSVQYMPSAWLQLLLLDNHMYQALHVGSMKYWRSPP
jgi:hypothetical protein